MDEKLLKESSWTRAKQDFNLSLRTNKVSWGIGVVGVILFGFFGAMAIPSDPKNWEAAGYPALGVLIGLVVAFLLILAWNLFRAPYRQRNDARRYANELRGQTMSISDRLYAIQKLEDMVPSGFWGRDAQGGIHLLRDDGNARAAKLEGNLLYRVELGLTAIPEALVETIQMDILGVLYPAGEWVSEKITHTERRVLSIEIPISVNRGTHSVRFLASFNGIWRRSDEYFVDYP